MITKSKTETQKIAAKLARKILKVHVAPRQARELLFPERSRRATLIALSGNLGSGKTTFVQGFMKAMGVKHQITSPTFIIFRRHEISKSSKLKAKSYQNVFHFDLYRLDKSQDVLKLGFKKIISDKNNIVLIEWPELIKKKLPKDTIWVNFEQGKKENERILNIIV